MHFGHNMRVSVLPAKEVTAPPKVETEATMQAKKQAKIVQDIAARASAGAYGGGIEPPMDMPDVGELGERCRGLLSKMLGKELLTRCSKDYVGFVQFWKDRTSGVKKSKKN